MPVLPAQGGGRGPGAAFWLGSFCETDSPSEPRSQGQPLLGRGVWGESGHTPETLRLRPPPPPALPLKLLRSGAASLPGWALGRARLLLRVQELPPAPLGRGSEYQVLNTRRPEDAELADAW